MSLFGVWQGGEGVEDKRWQIVTWGEGGQNGLFWSDIVFAWPLSFLLKICIFSAENTRSSIFAALFKYALFWWKSENVWKIGQKFTSSISEICPIWLLVTSGIPFLNPFFISTSYTKGIWNFSKFSLLGVTSKIRY